MITGAASLVLAIPALKVKGPYLALLTQGFGEIIRIVMINWTPVTNGTAGILKIESPRIFGFTFDTLKFFGNVYSMYMKTIEQIEKLTDKSFGEFLVLCGIPLVIDFHTAKILSITFSGGRTHDFKLFKQSNLPLSEHTLKRFRILSSKYRNAPQSFINTFTLICGLYNFQCKL